MRIRAIRAKNLASLPEFDVNLDADPIRSAGIFAITGPTGAGKSTILDALSLALFDSIPRMDTAEQGITIGKAGSNEDFRMKYNDVRGIMRHGTGEAFAEVDFVGQDGGNYKARWEVTRARGRSSGRLQNQKMTLTNTTTGQVIGDRKSETLAEIEKRVGLGFEQFRRSVLLAQGDFDAFVRANSRDRAELLERITGTEIYSQVSISAHERARREGEALTLLLTQRGEYEVLAPERRALIEQQVATYSSELERFSSECEVLRNAKQWFELRKQLLDLVDTGAQILAKASAANQEAAPGRDLLEKYRRGLSVRTEITSYTNAEQQATEADRSLQHLTSAGDTASAALLQATEALRNAQVEFVARSKAYDEIGPQLDQAKALDALLTEKQEQLHDRENEVSDADQQVTLIDALGSNNSEKLRDLEAKQATKLKWRAQHTSVVMLAAGFVQVSKTIASIIKVHSSLAKNRADTEANVAARHKANRETTLRGKEVADLTNAEKKLSNRIKTLSEEIRSAPRKELKSKRDGLADAQKAIIGLRAAAEKATESWQSIQQEEADHSAAVKRLDTLAECIADATRVIPQEQARLEEAQRNVELFEAAQSKPAQLLQTKLVPGMPCPVCGSTKHAVQKVDEELRAAVMEGRHRVRELVRSVQNLHDKVSQASGEKPLVEASLAKSTANEKKARAALAASVKDWNAWRGRLGKTYEEGGVQAEFSDNPVTPDSTKLERIAGVLEENAAAVNQQLAKIAAQEDDLAELRQSADQVRSNLDVSKSGLETATSEEQRLGSEQEGLAAALRELRESYSGLCEQVDSLLTPIVGDWRAQIASQGEGFLTNIRAKVESWESNERDLKDVEGQLQQEKATAVGLSAKLEAAQSTRKKALAAAAQAREELEARRGQRILLFGGRPASEVRTEYRIAKENAEKTLRKAEQCVRDAETASTQATVKLQGAKSAHEAASKKLKTVAEERDTALRSAGLELPDAIEAIQRGQTWVDEEAQRLKKLADAVAAASATLEERKRSLREHEQTGPPIYAADQIARIEQEIEANIVSTNTLLIRDRATLEADSGAVKRVVELTSQIELQAERVRIWSSVNDLIGSADGAKFRRFAQSLTFDQLIHFANEHLVELKPRFELQRAPASDHLGLQVIDHDLADEVRAVHALSGGERFLVSLALALGLASMSSNRGIRVETLFIDEGFGALDGESLGQAIAVLEHLQATGRRIGVISHVEELKERVPVRIDVIPQGNGRSSVKVVAQ